MTAAEAFLLHLAKTGLAGDGPAARQTLAAIETARAGRLVADDDLVIQISWSGVEPGSVTPALAPLRMGRTLDCRRETARVVLEPWIVEAALARLGARRLAREQQRAVVQATRTPDKVPWPDWWVVRPAKRRGG